MKTAAWKSHDLLLGSGFTYRLFFPAQLTSHSVGKFSCWVVVLGQRKMCRRDSESRGRKGTAPSSLPVLLYRPDVNFSHGNWVSMSTHRYWENHVSKTILFFFEQRQPFLQFSPIIEMLLPIYHGSLKAFIIVHLSCRWHTYHTYKWLTKGYKCNKHGDGSNNDQ